MSIQVIKAGSRVAFCATREGIRLFGHNVGTTEIVFAAGTFEVWRTRADYRWDPKRLIRVVVPSTYRIVKRVGNGFYFMAGFRIPCEYVFVMRCLVVGDDWRATLRELSEQTMLLCQKERK